MTQKVAQANSIEQASQIMHELLNTYTSKSINSRLLDIDSYD